MKDFLEIGKIVNTHGLRGEVKIIPWCDSAEFICEFDCLYLDDKGENSLQVNSAKVMKNMAVVSFENYDSIEQAESLKNKILYMNRDDVELSENSYFIQDLIGLEVYNVDTNLLYGTLVDVLETGANDVYVIKGEKREYLIPAIADVVIETDIDNKKMLIRPLKGLFDDED